MIKDLNWNEVIDFLQRQEKEWIKQRDETEEAIQKAPQGRISLKCYKGKYPQYYYSDTSGKAERYIRLEERQKIGALLQKRYDQKCYSALNENLNVLHRFLEKIAPNRPEELFLSLSDDKKARIRPLVIPDEDFLKSWLESMEKKKSTASAPDYPLPGGIVTDKGELVRSKSEKIIADKLLKMDLPYFYEEPLVLKGYGTVFPDFTILDLAHRKTVYLEHFGMMDDADYCQKALNKIQAYVMNHFWPGDTLLCTFETSQMPLNMICLDEMLKNRFWARRI